MADDRSLRSRVLETEAMDSPGEAADYDAMDHAEVNRRFVADFLTACGGVAPRGEVLDLGTGTAQIPIALCRQDQQVRVHAADLAGHMLELARRNVAAAELSGRIVLERVDAKRLPFADGRFAAVISNSLVHHLADPRVALAEVLRVAATGSVLFVRDLLRPADESTLRTLVATYAGGCNVHQRQMFEDSLRAGLTLAEIRTLVASLDCDPAEVESTSDRHWTWHLHQGQ